VAVTKEYIPRAIVEFPGGLHPEVEVARGYGAVCPSLSCVSVSDLAVCPYGSLTAVAKEC
jgi:hypothetical protein